MAIKRAGVTLKPSEIALLQAEAEGWRPEKGDEVSGTVLGVKMGTSTFGNYPIVFVLRDGADAEPVAIHAFHTTIQNELMTLRPQQGDAIFVVYLGPKENWEGPKGYDPPELYAVSVVKPGGVPADPWDAFGPAKPATTPNSSEEFTEPAPF